VIRWIAIAIAGASALAHADDRAHRVIVLPVDGTADPALRAKLTQEMQKLARRIAATVNDGDTTFAETATAIGCDPQTPACADSVLQTLAVDEIVYGTASATDAGTKLVVRRVTKDAPAREASTTIAPADSPDRVEPRIAPLFPGGPKEEPVPIAGHPPPPIDETEGVINDRNIGIAAIAGGGAAFVIGLALWANESGVQSDIDKHPANTPSDFRDLKSLEDKADTYATWGNLMVITGLALGGVGAYFLWRDHHGHVVITPTATDHGAALVIGGRW
jgi:hypothetical protein